MNNTSKINIHNTEISFPILSVDPGEKTGWAFWIDSMRQAPLETGIFTLKKVEDTPHYLQDSIEILCVKFKDIIDTYIPKTIIIEGCEVFGMNSKSIMTVKRNKHTNIPPLFVLAYLIGAYMNVATSKNANVFIKNFRDWGGNLSPEAVQAQIQLLTNTVYKSQHIYDAVGLGLNILGRM